MIQHIYIYVGCGPTREATSQKTNILLIIIIKIILPLLLLLFTKVLHKYYEGTFIRIN